MASSPLKKKKKNSKPVNHRSLPVSQRRWTRSQALVQLLVCAPGQLCSTRPVAPHSSFFFFFNDTATTEIYTLSLHDALPICTRLNSSHGGISYAVFWSSDVC